MKNMKNTVSILLFLFVFLSACSDDSIPEKLKPEPPQPDVEEPNPDDDSENSGNNQNSVLPALSVVGRYLKNEREKSLICMVLHRLTALSLIIMLGIIMMCRAVSIIIRVWWTGF